MKKTPKGEKRELKILFKLFSDVIMSLFTLQPLNVGERVCLHSLLGNAAVFQAPDFGGQHLMNLLWESKQDQAWLGFSWESSREQQGCILFWNIPPSPKKPSRKIQWESISKIWPGKVGRGIQEINRYFVKNIFILNSNGKDKTS